MKTATLCLLSLALIALPAPVAEADPVHWDGTCLWVLPHGPEKVGPVHVGRDWPLVCLIP